MSSESRILLLLLKYRRLLVTEISSLSGLSPSIVTEIVSRHRGLVKIVDGEVVVENPVELALELISSKIEPACVSELLDWRDFEELSARILENSGYEVVRGLKLTTPVRLEIDVFGVELASKMGIAVDCKHWSLNTTSKLVEAAERHAERVGKLIKYFAYARSKYRLLSKAAYLVPAIVTLFTPPIRAHSGVLIFSIREMPQVLRELRVVLDSFEIKPIKIPRTA